MKSDFVALKRWLKRRFKTKIRYSVHLVSHETIKKYRKDNGDYAPNDEPWDGYCFVHSNIGKILIYKGLKEWQIIYTLIHEFAHILQFEVPGETGGHGPVFRKLEKSVFRKWKKHINVPRHKLL